MGLREEKLLNEGRELFKQSQFSQAEKILNEINTGKPFTEMVKKYSLAKDKNNKNPGLLPVIKNDPDLHKKPRIYVLCMIPNVNEVKLLQNKNKWEIVKSEKKVMGYTPLNDKSTIITDIKKILALDDLQKEYEDTKRELLDSADIHLNNEQFKSLLSL